MSVNLRAIMMSVFMLLCVVTPNEMGIENFMAKFWTLSNFINYRLIIQKRCRKTKKSISELPITKHFRNRKKLSQE
jgi:hypothetical protein